MRAEEAKAGEHTPAVEQPPAAEAAAATAAEAIRAEAEAAKAKVLDWKRQLAEQKEAGQGDGKG